MTTKATDQTPAVQEKNTGSHSERFTAMVIKEVTSSAGDITISNFQRKLCQNYFIKLDATLRENEQKRMAKSEQYREAIPFTWEYINMQKLAQDVISFSSIGMDPCQKNHINLIPYGNSKTGKYDIGFLIGYVGLELKAKKYGYDAPDDVIIEVVFSKETFIPIKKDKDNPVETYVLKPSEDPFDKGEVRGGFYYHNWTSTPEKNKIRVFSLADIEKRRPDKASAEFWGGQKDEYKDGKKTGKKIEVEGWFEEMVYKTLARAAYDSIAIDSQKIDENFLRTMEAEGEYTKIESSTEEKKNQISSRANKQALSFEEPKIEETTYEEIKDSVKPELVAPTETQATEKPTPSVEVTKKSDAELSAELDRQAAIEGGNLFDINNPS